MPDLQPVQDLQPIGDTPERAVSFLCQLGSAYRIVRNLDVYMRVQFGKQLLAIKDSGMWSTMERLDYYTNPQGPQPLWANGESRNYLSFEHFMNQGVPATTGFKREFAYKCLRLARSEVVTSLGEEIREYSNLGNLIELVRVENSPREVTEEMREAAKEMDHEEFVERFGLDRPVIAANVEAGGDKAFIIDNLLNRVDQTHLRQLRAFVEQALPRCGDNANDIVDMIEAGIMQEWQAEEDAERARWNGRPVEREAPPLPPESLEGVIDVSEL